jgi:hypothetical protein
MEFEWDEAKNQENITKHGIDFTRAKEIFTGRVLEEVDDRYDYGETRIIATGMASGQEITVVYTMRGNVSRIISARKATENERRAYYQTQAG